MARIRSIHPGLFTDEAFMSASAHARLLMIGIWTEAWDDGVFEWKPLTLKVRLFPIDPVDMAALLLELERLNFVRRFSANGREYGAIRNFKRYQKPKKPSFSNVLPSDLLSYVAWSTGESGTEVSGGETGSEPVPPGEEGIGREEEGEGEGNRAGAQLPLWPEDFEKQFSDAYPRAAGHPAKLKSELLAIQEDGVEFAPLLRAVRSYAEAAEPKFICNAERWLRERRFRNEPVFRARDRPAPVENLPTVWVREDSDEGRAWAEVFAASGDDPKWRNVGSQSGKGRYMPSRWPPRPAPAERSPEAA